MHVLSYQVKCGTASYLSAALWAELNTTNLLLGGAFNQQFYLSSFSTVFLWYVRKKLSYFHWLQYLVAQFWDFSAPLGAAVLSFLFAFSFFPFSYATQFFTSKRLFISTITLIFVLKIRRNFVKIQHSIRPFSDFNAPLGTTVFLFLSFSLSFFSLSSFPFSFCLSLVFLGKLSLKCNIPTTMNYNITCFLCFSPL